jgi:hypothetical protein
MTERVHIPRHACIPLRHHHGVRFAALPLDRIGSFRGH